jgi:Family of unknown function (DUF6353)
MNFSTFKFAIKNNSTSILSGFAIAGMFSSIYLAAKAAPKASEALEEAMVVKKDFEWDVDTNPNEVVLTKREVVEATWRFYVPTAVAATATIACIVGANAVGIRRNAAVLAAYSMADTAFREYKDEVIRTLGEAKSRKIDEKIAVRKMEANPLSSSQVIVTGGGDQLCYDTLTGRYFRSDIESIRRAENEINHRVLQDMCAAHNEFYGLLGLEHTSIGDELGWNIDNLISLIFAAHLSDNGTPCIAIAYERLPRRDYAKCF